MVRTLSVGFVGIALLTSCGDNPVAVPNPNPVFAIFDEVQRDTNALPLVVSQDAHCTVINGGGWVTLHPDQTFVISLDNTTTTCDTAEYPLTSGILRKGTFTQRDTVIFMTLNGSAGAGIAAFFFNHPGYYPQLSFHYAGHDYIARNHESEAFDR